MIEEELKCPICNSKQIYTTSEERVCRRCGHRWEIKKINNNEELRNEE